jgi:hypothetical protein
MAGWKLDECCATLHWMSSHCCTGSLDHCHFSGANVLNTSARRSLTPTNHKLTSVVVSLRMSSCASSQSTSLTTLYMYLRLRVWRTSCNIPWSTAPRDPASYRCRSRPLALEGPSVIQGQGCHVLEQGSRQLLYCSRNTATTLRLPYHFARLDELQAQARPWKGTRPCLPVDTSGQPLETSYLRIWGRTHLSSSPSPGVQASRRP